MINGVVHETGGGTPQGGPLSPLLANILLDDLDRKLTRRGLRFVRYADDCNIFVASQRAGERVMKSVIRFVEGKLKLKVNREKSAVDRPCNRKFLGFIFLANREATIRLAPKTIERCKEMIRQITSRTRPVSMTADRGTEPLSDRIDRIFPSGRGQATMRRTGRVDSTPASDVSVEAVETGANPAPGTSSIGRAGIRGTPNGEYPPGPMGNVPKPEQHP
jgi:hypothetical protein